VILSSTQLIARVEQSIRDWNVDVQDTLETPGSFLAFGNRGNQPVVLKVVRQPGDEWRCGEVLEVFDGNGTVKVYEQIEGAVLLERLSPATPLAEITLRGRDAEATEIIAEVIQRISHSSEASKRFATVEDWGEGFQRYLASGDNQIARGLVEQAQQLYSALCASQRAVRLLHGDLQHYNILFDAERGWIAIDPKGVIGETEYEIGASLRNPCEKPEIFASAQAVWRRLSLYEKRLNIDANRALEWGYAQAVLSAIWTVEDASVIDGNNPALRLANAMQPMLR
jgi:streptomycin 6-kinase